LIDPGPANQIILDLLKPQQMLNTIYQRLVTTKPKKTRNDKA